MKFVDPTGLREIKEDPTSDEEERKDEREVKEHFSYMRDSYLTSEEIDNYSKLVKQQQKIDSASRWGKKSLENEYDELLISMLHTQNDVGMIPSGAWDKGGACLYRSTQAGVEYVTGKPLPMSMINDMTRELAGKNNGLEYMNLISGKASGSYFVSSMTGVADQTLKKLGYSNNYSSHREDNGKFVIAPENPYSSNNPVGGFMIREGDGHFNLGDHNGKFLWEPQGLNYGDRVPNPINHRFMLLEYK